MQNSKFKQLYDFCQDLPFPPPISRDSIKDKALELTGENVRIMKQGLDVNVSRGFFISAKDSNSPLVRVASANNVIIIARGMNRCWDRFVQTKELMHLFDPNTDKTSNPEQLKELLEAMTSPAPGRTQLPQLFSEGIAMYMALACLCPERVRQDLIREFKKGHKDYYAIALQLRIPEKYVPYLLRDDFLNIVSLRF